MKEATGEANMTVVTILLIGIVAVIGTAIVNGLLSNTGKKACVDGGGTWNSESKECTY